MPPPIPPRQSPGPAGSGRRRGSGTPGGSGEPGGQTGQGLIRGFPPGPTQPDPVYPPGQFSPWNWPSARAAWLGKPDGGGVPDDAEPGYSQLAVSDPSADATSTQTWAAIEHGQEAGDWNPRAGRRGQAAGAVLAAPAAAGTSGQMLRGQVLAPPGAGPGGASGDYPDAEEDGTGRGGPPRGRRGRRASALAEPGPPEPGPPDPGLAEPGLAEPGRPDAEEPGPVRRRRGAGRAAAAGRSPRSHRQLLLIGFAVALLVVGGGAYFLLSGGQAPARPTAAPRLQPTAAPSTSGPAAPPGPWKFIQSRADDPQPLSLTELYPAQYPAGGQSATLTIDKAGKNCAGAVLGATLENAVLKAHCTQVLRATYLTSDHQLMGTIGVLNLIDVAAAERVGKATGASEFIDPLVGPSGPTHNIKKGTGIEEAEVKGHYLILIWAEFSDLHSPSTSARRQQLEQFATGLISGTANVSLTSRMVTGKPH